MKRKSFYETVNPILEERGIRKGAFCRAIGVHPNMYPKYQRGVEPKIETIRAAEEFLGISILAGEEKNPATESDGKVDKYGLILELFDSLPFDKQMQFAEWLKAEAKRQSTPGDPEAK